MKSLFIFNLPIRLKYFDDYSNFFLQLLRHLVLNYKLSVFTPNILIAWSRLVDLKHTTDISLLGVRFCFGSGCRYLFAVPLFHCCSNKCSSIIFFSIFFLSMLLYFCLKLLCSSLELNKVFENWGLWLATTHGHSQSFKKHSMFNKSNKNFSITKT